MWFGIEGVYFQYGLEIYITHKENHLKLAKEFANELMKTKLTTNEIRAEFDHKYQSFFHLFE